MKRRHLLIAPVLLLAAPTAAGPGRVIVVEASEATDSAEILPPLPGRNRPILTEMGVTGSEELRAALRRALAEDVIVLTSINVTCHYMPLQTKVISLPGATAAELEEARKSLESGSGVDWPTRECACGFTLPCTVSGIRLPTVGKRGTGRNTESSF